MRTTVAGGKGVGATIHCSHGSFASIGTTLDWKPFRYFTLEHVPAGLALTPAIMVTTETHALPDGRTRVVQLTRASGRNPLARAAVALRRGKLEADGARVLSNLAAVMLRDQIEASTTPWVPLPQPEVQDPGSRSPTPVPRS